MEEKLLSGFSDPHSGHFGRIPEEYSDMDMRSSKTCEQSGQENSYLGIALPQPEIQSNKPYT
jgi:hypothetical protein